MKKSFNDHYIQTLEKRIRWGVEEEHGKRLARMLISARVKRLEQLEHDLIVKEMTSQAYTKLTGRTEL